MESDPVDFRLISGSAQKCAAYANEERSAEFVRSAASVQSPRRCFPSTPRITRDVNTSSRRRRLPVRRRSRLRAEVGANALSARVPHSERNRHRRIRLSSPTSLRSRRGRPHCCRWRPDSARRRISYGRPRTRPRPWIHRHPLPRRRRTLRASRRPRRRLPRHHYHYRRPGRRIPDPPRLLLRPPRRSRPRPINVGMYVGHGSIRDSVMGTDFNASPRRPKLRA